MTQKLTRPKGHGPLGYRTHYRLENLDGQVIAEGNYLRQFILLTETLGYEKVGETEQGFYTRNTPNGPETHPDGNHTPQPVFEGVDGPKLENHKRRVYKVKPINEEVTQ
jgi:hypothetical protein